MKRLTFGLVDKEQHQQEKSAVLNEALAHISNGRVSPIASILNSNWEAHKRPTTCGKWVKFSLRC